jgi:hypothetical protein
MEWYEKNKERICAKKREQYHTNPALKAKKKAQALARYYRLKTDGSPPNIFSNNKQDERGGAEAMVDS